MHRSGTSALTGVLAMAGAHTGTDDSLMPAHRDNPKGYWERHDVTELNDAILAAAGADWSHVSHLDSGQFGGAEFAPLQRRARRILERLEPHQPWVIKDPRMCLVFPLWRPLIESPVCILVHRSPEEVALSLNRRDGFPLEFGVALWEKYTREALLASKGLPRAIVSYHDLVTRPMAAVDRLFAELRLEQIPGLRKPEESELKAYLDPDLRRERGGPQPEVGLGAGQWRLLESIESGSALNDEPGPLSEEALKALRAQEVNGITDPRRERARLVRLRLEAMRELLRGGEADAARAQFAEAWRAGWREPGLWRPLWGIRASAALRGFSGRHTRHALKRTLKGLKRFRAEAPRG